MPVNVIHTDSAPTSSAPLSQAIRYGSLLFVSGQLGIDPSAGGMVAGGVGAETTQALANLRAILEAAGSSLANVVKTTCFLTDMSDFAAFNAAYTECFPGHKPARSTFQVVKLAGEFTVEIEAIAVIDGAD